MWVPFDTFGEVRGRVRGVAPAPNGQVLALTDRGLFALWHSRAVYVNTLLDAAAADAQFDPDGGTIWWNGATHTLFGGCAPGRDPGPLTRHPGGDRVAIDPDTGAVQLLDAAGGVQQTVDTVLTGEGAVAAFTPDGKVLVVADPAGVRLFRYAPTAGAERPRWSAVADPDAQGRLLKALIAHPDEDTPRLAYADWLEEHDDPARAEFIRVQCRLAAPPGGRPAADIDADGARAFQLETQLGERWRAELPAVRGVRWHGFWRGFPGVSVASPTTLVRSAAKVWAAAPVEFVTVTGLNLSGAKVLAASDVLRRVRVLSLERYYIRQDGDGPLRALLHAPRISALKRLLLPHSIGDAGVRAVAASPHLTGLEWLSVGSGGLSDATADALIAAPALRDLKGGSFVSYRLTEAARGRLRARFPHAAV